MSENKTKIKKAKIKDDLFLEVEFTENLPGHSKNDTRLASTVPVHDDLKICFQKLHKHLAILCDEVGSPKKKDFEDAEFPAFFVRGFSISGNDENEGVTISGYKEGKYGDVNLNTPFTKWNESEYSFVNELSLDIEAALHEVDQYLFHGKRAPEKQMEIGFPEGDEFVEDNSASTPDPQLN